MAIRYVKDFEFPSAAGYTKSATKVTGQMYAKGGAAKKRYNEGSNANDYSAQAADNYDRAMLAQMAGDANAVTEAEKVMRPRGVMTDTEARALANARASSKGKDASSKKKGSPYIPGSNIPHSAVRSAEEQAASEAGSGDVGPQYRAKGGKVAKVMREFNAGKLHSGSKKGPKVSSSKQAIAIALSEAGKSKMKKATGGMCYAEGGAKKPAPLTPEEKEDIVRKDQARGVKVMLGTQAKARGGKVRYNDGGEIPSDADLQKKAWQDRKQQRKDAGDKTKKPVFAKGGMAKHDDAAMDRKLVKQMVKPAALKKAMGGVVPPLQRMSLAAGKGVPVAPRAPMIAPPSMGQRGVGVNAKRPGGPDVGMIRNMMAKAATAARPDAAPSMMKKGGKVK